MRTPLRYRVTCFSALLACSLSAPTTGVGQIATDRPDFVESSVTVGHRAFQIETSLARDDMEWSTPTLVRIGIGQAFELRFESAVVTRLRTDAAGRGTQALAAADIGVKWHTRDQAHTLPSVALLVHAGLPLGPSTPGGNGSGPSLRAVAEWMLPGGLALGVMPGVALPREEGSREVQGIVGVVLGKELTPRLRTFGEVAVEGRAAAVNSGLALLVAAHTQIDAGVSFGVSGGASRIAVALGFSHVTAW